MQKAQFDTHTTHMSYYDRFLNPKDLEYMQESKNLTGEIEMMTPEEYFQYASEVFGYKFSVDDLIAQRSDEFLEKYIDDMRNGDVFPLCFINLADNSQEGLHRMLAAALVFGWDVEYPVLVVRPYDEELWAGMKRDEKVRDYMNYDLRHFINQAEANLGDWDEPVPEDIVDQFKKEIEDLAQQQGDSIDVDCELDEGRNSAGSSPRIITYLNRYNDIVLEEPVQSTDYAWLENMFDLDYQEKDIDEELLDLDEADLRIEDYFFK